MSGTTQDAELDAYKRMPIGRLAVQLGATPKNPKPKPTKGGDIDAENFVLNGWKFQCFQASSGHFMWKSHDGSLSVRGRNTGTIVDILVLLEGSLGKARQRLRGLTGYSPSSPTSGHEELTPAAVSAASPSSSCPVSSTSPAAPTVDPLPTPAELEAAYEERGPIWNLCDPVPAYLRSRGLEKLHPVFHQTFRVSKSGRGSVFLPYIRCSDEGQGWEHAGCEQKSLDWKSYDKGGRAGIWTAAFDMVHRLIVTESPIDAMSYAFLMSQYDDFSVAFISLRSGGEGSAIEFAAGLIEQKGLREIVLATDNDGAGMLYAAKVMAGLHKHSKSVRMRYEAPIHGARDWNDALMIELEKRRKSGSSTADIRENDASPAEFDPRDGIELG